MIIGLSDHIDLALIVLYLFWIFFFGLIYYINRESTREGFPAVSEATGKQLSWGVLGMPKPKVFKLDDGREILAPRTEIAEEPGRARPMAPWSGAPLMADGDPMTAEFGPGAYANRLDEVLRTHHGQPKIMPLRDLPSFEILKGERDPRGLPVIAGDGKTVGEVADVWIDQEEQLIRYLEVSIGARNVLVPMTLARVGGRLAKMGIWRPEVRVRSLLSRHFDGIPATKSPNTVTLLEEDKITAYFGAGTFYATRDRNEPLI